jgi:uncharacterized protein
MTHHTLTSEQECEDFVRGSCFFGVGGGGDPAAGIRMLKEDLAAGIALTWIDMDELDDAAITCCAWGMGSIAPRDPEETQKEINRFGVSGPVHVRNLSVAVQELERYADVKIEAIIPLEPGGRNTPNPLSSGARLGIPIVDGDYSGRAVPEIVQIIPCISGHKPWPSTSVDPFGNSVIIREAATAPMAERIGKQLAVAAFGTVGMAGFLMPAKAARELFVPGTASRSLSVGRAIREARDAGSDPVAAAVAASGAHILFKGTVSGREWEDRDGYMFGTNVISGEDAFSGRKMKIWFKNENHVTWIDSTPYVTSPDLIIVLDSKTGEPKTNTVVEKGMAVGVLGIPAPAALRTAGALKVMAPRWFGFDIPYRPMEEII